MRPSKNIAEIIKIPKAMFAMFKLIQKDQHPILQLTVTFRH